MILNRQTKFVVFGQGRSGSTLLKQLLDSHPLIKCEGELLNEKDGYLTRHFLRRIVYKFPLQAFNLRAFISNIECYGFTLLFYQYYPPETILQKLYKNGWKIIHLTRSDAFRQTISHFVARETKLWHRTHSGESRVEEMIRLDPAEFNFWMNRLLRNKHSEEKIFRRLPHFMINYEADLKDKKNWQPVCNNIFEYLSLPHAPVRASLKKTYTIPYSRIVENYDELKSGSLHLTETLENQPGD